MKLSATEEMIAALLLRDSIGRHELDFVELQNTDAEWKVVQQMWEADDEEPQLRPHPSVQKMLVVDRNALTRYIAGLLVQDDVVSEELTSEEWRRVVELMIDNPPNPPEWLRREVQACVYSRRDEVCEEAFVVSVLNEEESQRLLADLEKGCGPEEAKKRREFAKAYLHDNAMRIWASKRDELEQAVLAARERVKKRYRVWQEPRSSACSFNLYADAQTALRMADAAFRDHLQKKPQR